jgi:hypothetical protein
MTEPAFKEWSLVCDALGAGAQSIILRKGGIHEGRGGFWWKHDRFHLFPTHFHEQRTHFPWDGPGAEFEPAPDAGHRLTLVAAIDFKIQITRWEDVAALRDYHFWTEAALRDRFEYSENAGISMAFVRVYRREEVWALADEPRFGGCRSWLDLPAPTASVEQAVLDDAEHERRREALRDLLRMP